MSLLNGIALCMRPIRCSIFVSLFSGVPSQVPCALCEQFSTGTCEQRREKGRIAHRDYLIHQRSGARAPREKKWKQVTYGSPNCSNQYFLIGNGDFLACTVNERNNNNNNNKTIFTKRTTRHDICIIPSAKRPISLRSRRRKTSEKKHNKSTHTPQSEHTEFSADPATAHYIEHY